MHIIYMAADTHTHLDQITLKMTCLSSSLPTSLVSPTGLESTPSSPLWYYHGFSEQASESSPRLLAYHTNGVSHQTAASELAHGQRHVVNINSRAPRQAAAVTQQPTQSFPSPVSPREWVVQHQLSFLQHLGFIPDSSLRGAAQKWWYRACHAAPRAGLCCLSLSLCLSVFACWASEVALSRTVPVL